MNVSPMMEILVLEFAAAAASTSAKCAVSDAFSPKADRLSVTISDTCARSSPAAAARLITPLMPPSISWASQPAIAMYSIAFALCCAVNLVVAPSSFASAVSAAISEMLESAIASTADMACSKFPAISTHSEYASAIPFMASAIPAAAMAPPTASIVCKPALPNSPAPSAAFFCSSVSSWIFAVSSASLLARSVVLTPAASSRSFVSPSFCFCFSSADSVFIMRCSSLSFSRSSAVVEPVVSPICLLTSSYCRFRFSSFCDVFCTAAACFS